MPRAGDSHNAPGLAHNAAAGGPPAAPPFPPPFPLPSPCTLKSTNQSCEQVTPIMRLGAHTTLQLADLPPPPRTWRADWLDAQTACIMDGEQGGRGRKEEEYFEGEGEERGRKEEYIEGEGEERGRKEEEYIEGEGEERGRKEDEQCEGEQGERRAGRGSGQLVVSGGWKAGGRGRGKWPFWAVLYWPHRWALLLLAVMFLGESMLHVVKAVLLYRIIAFLEACDSSSSSDGSSCVEGQCGSIEGYLTAAGLGALAVALAVVTQHLCYRAYVSPPPSDPSTRSPTWKAQAPSLCHPNSAKLLLLIFAHPPTLPPTVLPTPVFLPFPPTRSISFSSPAVHRHLLTLTASALSHVSSGHCINLLSNDVRRLDDLVFCSQALWVLVLVTWLVAREIGWVPTIAGIATQLLLLPLQVRPLKLGYGRACGCHVADIEGYRSDGCPPSLALARICCCFRSSCFLSPTCTLLSPSQTTEQYQLACGKWRVWLRAKTAEATDARVKHTEEVGGWGGGRGKEWGWGRGRGGLDGGGEERGWVREGRRGVGLQWTAALNAMMAALYFSFTSVVAFESSINPLHPPVPLLSTSLQWTAALNAVTAALYFSFTSVVAFESSINPLHPPFPLPSTSLQWTAALNAVTAALYFSFTSVVALVTFATFTCLGGQLTAASVFYVLTLLEVRCTSPCFYAP
ncbi:unnamed protein product [Closterium sp. Naga37s-1]|nr:unnamed protein product [Closterium sp. Naga37s-1]CAI5488964.1 unnamed protein product [Closterium sp. Naga37s-1]